MILGKSSIKYRFELIWVMKILLNDINNSL